MVVCRVARILATDVGRTLMNMEMLKFLRTRASKIIPCVVFNKVVHIIHPSRSMPFFRTPSNDRLWLPQASIKSFNDLCIKSNSFCHLREMLYESPFPKVSRYGIMAITSSLLWNHAPSYSSVELLPTKLNLRHLFLPSLLMCVLCLSSRDVPTSHSMSWSWVLDPRVDRFL